MKETPAELRRLRRRIDTIDGRVLVALADRFKLVEQIGELKRRAGLDSYQAARWEELLAARVARANALGLGDRFTRALFELVHEEALAVQRALDKPRRRRRPS